MKPPTNHTFNRTASAGLHSGKRRWRQAGQLGLVRPHNIDTGAQGTEVRAMIARHWKGIAKREQADNYIAHLKRDTFPKLASLSGFVRASILRREVASGIEFQVVSVWESTEAIQAFAGADAEAAVVPAVAQAMMVEFDRRATHYEIAHTFEAK
jgi:heme-degrading monooxygenase HmoA